MRAHSCVPLHTHASLLLNYDPNPASCDKGRDTLDLSASVVPDSAWQAASGDATINGTAASVRLHLECNGDLGFRVWFDDISFGIP